MFVLHPRSSRKDSRQLEHQEFSSSNTGMTIPLGRTEAVCPQHSKNQINTHWLWAPGLRPPHGAELGKIPRLLLWNGLFSPPHPTNSWSHLGAQLICRLCWEALLTPTGCQSLSPRVVPAQHQCLSLHSPTSQTRSTLNQGLTLTHLLVTACGINLSVLL